ncbi:phosphate/phosphite/phosphonate ABC transporter substrate-binding protein [Pseudoalteromonas sp. T1lg48]|uniref:phosphate/phosphite/phosphonate ABC transporter substrate-binding protein n=1 Tax=Pseudoalteromonas sp. T1lg48 TaxID=2077100 RepID=UPI001F1824E4|nr:phosphate/phosphite/phosphonate ABC transporter substrate-binding protein [Pseudoalteromonas sp. T1lg48]
MQSIKRWRDSALILTTITIVGLVSYLVGQYRLAVRLPQLESVLTTSFSCNTLSAGNKTTLTLFAPSQALASELAQQLCANEVVSKQYGEVFAYWSGSSQYEVNFLGKGLAHLILAKDNMIHAFDARNTYGYTPLIGYPSYTAYFIASHEKPRLDKAYFLDKRIGLIDYPTSRSGHIIPKQIFKDLDLNLDSLDITFVNSHSALRDKLAQGELDIISSYWQQSDHQRFSENYITAIGSNISGSHWYLKRAADNPDLACAIQTTLMTLAQARTSSYFNGAKPYWQCQQGGGQYIGAGL